MPDIHGGKGQNNENKHLHSSYYFHNYKKWYYAFRSMYMFITATCMLIAPCTCMWLTILQWHVYIYTSMMTCFLVFLPPRSQIVGYFSKSMEFVMAWTSELANMCITYNNKWKDMCNYFHGTTTTNGKTCATLSMVVTQFAIA